MPDLEPREMALVKANQMIAQSCAIAVQDAVDNLRNVNLICTAAIGVLTAKYVATKDKDYPKMVVEVGKVATQAAENFADIGKKSAAVLKEFQ